MSLYNIIGIWGAMLGGLLIFVGGYAQGRRDHDKINVKGFIPIWLAFLAGIVITAGTLGGYYGYAK